MLREHLHYDDRMDWILGGDRVHAAVVMMEGFDHLIASLFTVKGWSANPSSIVAGRFGDFGAHDPSAPMSKTLPSTYTTLIVGFALKTSSSQVADATLVRLLTAASGVVADIAIRNSDKKLIVMNSGGTTIAAGTTTITTGVWNYVELKIVVNGASGSCEVHLNGVTEIASTTGNFGSTAIGIIRLNASSGTGLSYDFDDVYACDTTGSARNTFLGDVRVKTIYPDGDGAHTQWTPSSGTNHFDRVNEHTGTYPDGDTTYVSDATPGDIDTYTMGDIDGAATVHGVQVNSYARKDDAATRQIAPVIRKSGTDYVGNTFTLTSSYAFQSQLYDQDPSGVDWTATTVNGMEVGVKEIA